MSDKLGKPSQAKGAEGSPPPPENKDVSVNDVKAKPQDVNPSVVASSSSVKSNDGPDAKGLTLAVKPVIPPGLLVERSSISVNQVKEISRQTQRSSLLRAHTIGSVHGAIVSVSCTFYDVPLTRRFPPSAQYNFPSHLGKCIKDVANILRKSNGGVMVLRCIKEIISSKLTRLDVKASACPHCNSQWGFDTSKNLPIITPSAEEITRAKKEGKQYHFCRPCLTYCYTKELEDIPVPQKLSSFSHAESGILALLPTAAAFLCGAKKHFLAEWASVADESGVKQANALEYVPPYMASKIIAKFVLPALQPTGATGIFEHDIKFKLGPAMSDAQAATIVLGAHLNMSNFLTKYRVKSVIVGGGQYILGVPEIITRPTNEICMYCHMSLSSAFISSYDTASSGRRLEYRPQVTATPSFPGVVFPPGATSVLCDIMVSHYSKLLDSSQPGCDDYKATHRWNEFSKNPKVIEFLNSGSFKVSGSGDQILLVKVVPSRHMGPMSEKTFDEFFKFCTQDVTSVDITGQMAFCDLLTGPNLITITTEWLSTMSTNLNLKGAVRGAVDWVLEYGRFMSYFRIVDLELIPVSGYSASITLGQGQFSNDWSDCFAELDKIANMDKGQLKITVGNLSSVQPVNRLNHSHAVLRVIEGMSQQRRRNGGVWGKSSHLNEGSSSDRSVSPPLDVSSNAFPALLPVKSAKVNLGLFISNPSQQKTQNKNRGKNGVEKPKQSDP